MTDDTISRARAKVRATNKARDRSRSNADIALLDALDAGASYGQLAQDLKITRASVQSRVRAARRRLNE